MMTFYSYSPRHRAITRVIYNDQDRIAGGMITFRDEERGCELNIIFSNSQAIQTFINALGTLFMQLYGAEQKEKETSLISIK